MTSLAQPMKPADFRFAVLAVDLAVVTIIDRVPSMLVMPVHLPPDIVRAWALPGGLLRPDETAEDAVARLLKDKCGLEDFYTEQLATFSAVDRDPRGRVVSVAYLVLVPEPVGRAHELPDGLSWRDLRNAGKLAYDHNAIASAALERLRERLLGTTIVRHLVAPQFTLGDLQIIYQSVLGRELDKRNFRRKLLAEEIVRPTRKTVHLPLGRPSELYRFAGTKVRMISPLSVG